MNRILYISLFISVFTIIETVFGGNLFYHGRMIDISRKLGVLEKPSKYERWFTQNLDHFHPTDERTWQQRYYVNEAFLNASSRNLAFLMIGGEGDANAQWMEEGSWIDWAKEFQAICFQLEHRFYGKSHPTEDLSIENLKYLNSQQALADLAFFIEAMNVKHELTPDAKWIVFGGSYPGSLAAWVRLKNPHLVHGAVSSSGPLMAKLNYDEYFKVVADDIRLNSMECLDAVQEGTAQAQVLLNDSLGQMILEKLFNLCDPVGNIVDNDSNISNLFKNLAGNFATFSQFNKDNAIGKLNVTLDTLCDIMVNQTIGTQISRLAAVNSLVLNFFNQTCLEYKYNEMIQEMENISWNFQSSVRAVRQWTYQTCTEFGFYPTSDYKPQIFGDKFPLDSWTRQCVDIFGPEFDLKFLQKAVDATNVLYGALDIDVTNVVFVQGSVDPWQLLGITSTMSNLTSAILIEGTGHCADMDPARDTDLPQLKAARVHIQQQISSWLD